MKLSAVVVLVLLLVGIQARAGGFEFPTNGTAALGRGGAFTALADDLVCLQYNPAGLIKIPGTNVYLGNNMSNFDITYTAVDLEGNVQNPVSNTAGLFWLAPFIAASSDFGLEDFTFSLGVYGPSAYGKSSFDEEGPQRYMLIGTDIVMVNYTLAAAYRISDRIGVGLSLHWVDLRKARFSMYVNGTWEDPEYSNDSDSRDVLADIEVSDHVNVSATLGFWARPWDFLEVGASFRGPSVSFDATGTSSLDFKGAFIQGMYNKGIETGGTDGLVAYDNNADPTAAIPTRFSFSYPMSGRLGVRYVHRDPDRPERALFDVEADVVWEGWSVMDAYNVDMEGYMKLTDSTGRFLQKPKEIPFKPVVIPKHLDDTWSVRLGGQVSPLDWLTLRLGGYHETGSVPTAYTNLDFASFDRYGLGVGFAVRYDLLTFSFSYSHVFQANREVTLEDTEVYKQFPIASSEAEGDIYKIGAGTYETSFDVFSMAVNLSF